MPERRRWVDVWHARSRGEALDRVQLLQDEYVAAAFAGDRKWCVLVAHQVIYVRLVADSRGLDRAIQSAWRAAPAVPAPTS